MSGSPLVFSIGFTTANYNYFNNTVKPQMTTNCGVCHGGLDNYYAFKSLLMTPNQSAGGTATNNFLYDKATGHGHSGGARCSLKY